MKRCVTVFLAAWYLWLGLGIPFPAPAVVSSAEAAVAPVEFPCAGHDCGCGTAEACRLHCCCFPNQAPVPVSFRSAMGCQGEESGGPVVSSSSFGAHLPVSIADLKEDASRGRAPGITRFSRRAIPADPPGKIPI